MFEAYYWFAIAAILIVIEIATMGLTTIWFAVGALLAGFLNLFGVNLWIQIIVFGITALILLVLTRPWAQKFLNSKTQKTNADSLVGEVCLTTAPVDNLKGEGKVQVRGMEWSARSEDGNPIPKDKKVRILKIQGVKLIVEPYDENEEK